MCNNVYNVYTLYMYIRKHMYMYMYMYVCNYHPLEDNIKLIFMPSVEFYSSLVSSAPLLTMLGSGSSEVVYTCLQHVQLLLARQPDMWSSSYQNFFCRYALYLVFIVELCLSDTP